MSSLYTLKCIFATRPQCIVLYFVIDECDATTVKGNAVKEYQNLRLMIVLYQK